MCTYYLNKRKVKFYLSWQHVLSLGKMHHGHSETSEVFCFLMIAINENENALYYMKKSHFNIILIVYDSVWIWLVCCVEKMQLDVEMSQPAFVREILKGAIGNTKSL